MVLAALNTNLTVSVPLELRASNGGLFVSRGQGRHPDRVIGSFELIFVSEGVLELREEDPALGAQDFAVRAGEALILWPGRRHYGLSLYPADLSYYWLHFHLIGSSRDAPAPHLDVSQHTRIGRPDHLTSLFRRFLDDQETGAAQTPAASLLVLLMLYEVAGAYSPPASADAAALLAGRAHTLIRTHFHEPLSTSRLAGQLHCNPDYLGRVFHARYGLTLTEAVQGRRVKHARKLLLGGEHTVEQVAADCGFRDVGYFRRVFKRAEGMTPYTFRKLYSKMHVNSE